MKDLAISLTVSAIGLFKRKQGKGGITPLNWELYKRVPPVEV